MRAISAATTLLFLFLSFVLADLPSLQSSTAYDKGAFGHRPSQSYVSTNLISPRFNLLTSRDEHNDGLCTFLAPHGFKINKPGPLIIKDDTLVWTTSAYGKAFDFKVQQYNGQPYLTFWTGDDHVRGHGKGSYFMLDTSYNLFKRLDAGNGRDGDLHEFSITSEGRALITVYDRLVADLSDVSTAGSSGYIWDGLFQEVDIETGGVVFEWRASDHIPLTLSYRPVGREGSYSDPWDWFHINSVAKDEAGNYLVSSRYLEGLTYVSGTTGQVLWYLGGKQSNFTDLSDGSATDFAFQHDARWVGTNTITMFDNGVDYENPKRAPYSRGLHIALDLDVMTVRRIAEYNSPECHASPSQGSLQILANGNVLMGYGDVAAFTEFKPDGSVIRETHFAPQSEFGTDNVQSYRVFKYPWKGFPTTLPDVAVRGNSVYVSWNGATEVREWLLEVEEGVQDAHYVPHVVQRVPKAGFETVIPFDPARLSRYIYVSGLDAKGNLLGRSRPIDWTQERRLMTRLMEDDTLRIYGLVGMGMLIVGVCVLQLYKRVGRAMRGSFWKQKGIRYSRIDGDAAQV